MIDDLGILIDPDKTTAIAKFPTPKNVTELQRFLGMVNHVGKFVPRLADLNEPLRQLLHKDAVWRWEIAHQTAFLRIKEVLMSSEVLARYDPQKETIVAADASAIGVGAVLITVVVLQYIFEVQLSIKSVTILKTMALSFCVLK